MVRRTKTVNNLECLPPCVKKYGSRCVDCAKGKLCSVPLTRGTDYIGQLGRCLKNCLREHYNECSSPNEVSFHPIVLPTRQSHGCFPKFDQTRVTAGQLKRYGGEPIEAFEKKAATRNTAMPSISLTRHELAFITSEPNRTYSQLS